MDIQELLRLLRDRDDRALGLLQLHYGPLIRYIINPILPDARDREECFSDVLLRVWAQADRFDPDRGSWTGWLSVLARNAAIDRARKNPPDHEALPEGSTAPDADPEQQLLLRERREALQRAIRTLDHREQTIFYRKYYYRQSTAQIAAELGTTERAIEGRLYRIRKRLRQMLGGDGFDG